MVEKPNYIEHLYICLGPLNILFPLEKHPPYDKHPQSPPITIIHLLINVDNFITCYLVNLCNLGFISDKVRNHDQTSSKFRKV